MGAEPLIGNNNLDNIQTTLTVIGLVPGVGEFADVANAAISLARGDYGDAALNLAAAIPVLGSLAVGAKVTNTVIKEAKVVNAVEEAGKAVEKPLYRYMSEGELEAVKETGYLRGGNSGPTFWTDSSYKSAENAAERLSLPNTPQYRVEFEIKNFPTIEGGTRVQPNFNRLGGGREYWSNNPVQVEIVNAQPIGLR